MTNNPEATDSQPEANSGVTIPIRSVDPTASLEDRLTDNAQNAIGPARYFNKDADGNPTEDWGGVFNRVATNVAIPDAAFHDLSISITRNELADWAIDYEVDDSDAEALEAVQAGEARELDEHLAPYVDYEKLLERAPEEIEADLEETAGDFEQVMSELRFIPNSPTLMNAGNELQQLSACFVVEPGDAMTGEDESGRASIMGAANDAADVFKSGGGVGYPLHLMRPKGALVSSTGGVSSGPMSFAQIYDTVCGTVKQGGVRRGAQMAIMHSQHPDIGRFCVAKRDEENLSNFNISVAITDDFIEAVRNDEEYTLVDPRDGYVEKEAFDVVAETAHFYDPKFEDAWNAEYNKPGMGLDGKVVEENFWRDHQEKMQDPEAFDQFRDRIDLELGEELTLPARFIWRLLVDGAHHLGEPGFFYLDETNRQHSFDVEEHPETFIHATNPCAEQPLQNYEACNLGHVNLSLMVSEDAQSYDEWVSENFPDFEDFQDLAHVGQYLEHALDTEQFEETVQTGARFLENVVTMSKFPLEEIENRVHGQRKIGLGLMGFHQMLLQMGVQYGSSESYKIAKELMRRIDKLATETSHELALERGSFRDWEKSKWAQPTEYEDWFRKHGHTDPEDHEGGYEIRNHNVTTIAPTGTTSMIGNTTGGCEPMYNVAYYKNVSDDVQGDEMLVEFDDYFLRVLEANDVDVGAVKRECGELMRNDNFDGVTDLETVPDEIAELFVTTEDLNVEQHIRVQAAFQTYCDSGISKTLNIANDASIDDVGRAIDLALDLGIKGATIYRVDSRTEEVLTTSSTGGAVSVKEADGETLLEELADRVEEEPELREEIMGELDVVDTDVEVEEREKISVSD